MCSPLGAIVLISGIAIWSQRRDLSFSGDSVFYYLTCYRERACPSLCPFFPKTPFLEHPSEKRASYWYSGRVCRYLMGKTMWQKTARFKVLNTPTGEVQTCRILANLAKIWRILYTNRNRGFYRFFPRAGTNPGENRSSYRAYFTRFHHR